MLAAVDEARARSAVVAEAATAVLETARLAREWADSLFSDGTSSAWVLRESNTNSRAQRALLSILYDKLREARRRAQEVETGFADLDRTVIDLDTAPQDWRGFDLAPFEALAQNAGNQFDRWEEPCEKFDAHQDITVTSLNGKIRARFEKSGELVSLTGDEDSFDRMTMEQAKEEILNVIGFKPGRCVIIRRAPRQTA
jgi:hypothetical protein